MGKVRFDGDSNREGAMEQDRFIEQGQNERCHNGRKSDERTKHDSWNFEERKSRNAQTLCTRTVPSLNRQLPHHFPKWKNARMRARRCSGLYRKEQRKLPRRNMSFADGSKSFAEGTLPKEQRLYRRNKDFTEGTKTLPKEQRRTSELDPQSVREMRNRIRQCRMQGLASLFPLLFEIGTNKRTRVRVLLIVLICFVLNPPSQSSRLPL